MAYIGKSISQDEHLIDIDARRFYEMRRGDSKRDCESIRPHGGQQRAETPFLFLASR